MGNKDKDKDHILASLKGTKKPSCRDIEEWKKEFRYSETSFYQTDL